MRKFPSLDRETNRPGRPEGAERSMTSLQWPTAREAASRMLMMLCCLRLPLASAADAMGFKKPCDASIGQLVFYALAGSNDSCLAMWLISVQ